MNYLIKKKHGNLLNAPNAYKLTPGCRTPAAGSPTRALPPPWAVPRWICRSLWWESSSAAKRNTMRKLKNNLLLFRTFCKDGSYFCNAKQLSRSAHHVPVLLAGEVKRWQDGLELAEDLVVPRHVCGQDASAGRAERSAVLSISKMRRRARSVELL